MRVLTNPQAVARVIDAQDKLVEAAKSGGDLSGTIARYDSR